MIELSTTYICEKCGKELPTGLLNAIKHSDECKRDAPNSSIASHKVELLAKELDKEYQKQEKEFERIFAKMTKEEQMNLMFLSMNGTWDMHRNVVYMGSHAMDQLVEFKTKMKEKYGR